MDRSLRGPKNKMNYIECQICLNQKPGGPRTTSICGIGYTERFLRLFPTWLNKKYSTDFKDSYGIGDAKANSFVADLH
ncbi:MAG: hypothetical protein JWP45_2167 [Mucilaginibacter sp.]|nr:hypothetical protein [Mucilaginibacter sp.]